MTASIYFKLYRLCKAEAESISDVAEFYIKRNTIRTKIIAVEMTNQKNRDHFAAATALDLS